jgi:hypothetical protein
MATVMLDIGTRMAADASRVTDAHVAHLERNWSGAAQLDGEGWDDLHRGIAAAVAELASLMRSGLGPDALLTPVGVLAYATRMRRRGLSLLSLEEAYGQSLAVTRALVGGDDDALVTAFARRAVERLADGYGDEHGELSEGAPAAGVELPMREDAAAVARAQCADRLARFCDDVDDVAGSCGERLARAQATVVVRLADEPELAVTLMLDRDAPTILDGADPAAEAELRIPSVDLQHLWSREFHLPMAIVHGRVGVQGPVRRFLRIVPVLRGARAAKPAPTAAFAAGV